MDQRIKEKIIEIARDNEYMRNLGLEFLQIETGYIRGRMPVKPAIINPYGSVHGGALYALADIMAGLTACTGGTFVSTVNGHMSYLKPGMNTAYITCEAKVLHAGKKIITVTVALYNDDEVMLENGTFIFSVLENRSFL